MWPRGLAELVRGVGQLILPNACLVCAAPEGNRTDFRHGLCNDCRRAVTHDPNAVCPWCAATVGPHSDVSEGCIACRSRALGFDAAVRLGPYDGRLREAVLRMKSVAGEGLAESLGRLFGGVARSRLRDAGVEVVVPVPLHWRRWWSRGYNQAEAVAQEVASTLGVEFSPRALKSVRHAPQHAQPTASARAANVKGAFRAGTAASVVGRTVLLVDDVMTTGSTTGECARVLRAAGARRIVVGVLARR